MSKKVLFFIQSDGIGGAERVSINIAEMLPKQQYEVVFVGIGQNNRVVEFIPNGYRIEHIKVRNVKYWGIRRLVNLIKRENAETVFSSIMYINIRVLVAAKICGVRSIIRNNNTIFSQSRLIRFLMRYTYPMAHMIVAQQEEMRSEIIGHLGIDCKRVIVLQNPIQPNIIEKKVQEGNPYLTDDRLITFLCVGRFTKAKGQDILIKAFSIVRETIPEAHLYFVGKYSIGEDVYEIVKNFIYHHQLEDFVHILGMRENPYTWMKYCDCYVMPSRLEGLPNSLIEAMYLKRPVVGTLCVPIVARIIKDGYNGYIVPVENVDALAEAMIKALKLRDFRMTYKPATKDQFVALFES